MNGKWLLKNSSDNSEQALNPWLRLLLIFSAGAAVVALHKTFRWPLDLAGRHGLELFAVWVFIACSMRQQYAVSTAALGGAVALLTVSQTPAVSMSILLIQGLFLDFVANKLSRANLLLLLLPLFAGIAHTFKPLIKYGYQSGVGIYSDSLDAGLLYPVVTHFSFGFIGGMLGLIAWRAIQRSKQN